MSPAPSTTEKSSGPTFALSCFEKLWDGRQRPGLPSSGHVRYSDLQQLPGGGAPRSRRAGTAEGPLGRYEGHTYLLTRYISDEPIKDVLRIFGEHFRVPEARKVLRDVVRGLRESYTDLGLSVVYLDAEEIWIDMRTVASIGVTYLDPAVTGQQPFRPSALTVPEIIFGRAVGGDLRKADIWLLGVVAAQILSSKRLDPLVPDFSAAAAVAARILKQGRTGSGLELLLPDYSDVLPEDPQALDPVQQCLTVSSDERPTLDELWAHPFLAMAEMENTR
ncbi:hypothetical protein GGTG_04217 [Gaeumannomyces tritici R3-111a-1]|uniref:Protein kinase domain-containing protein n=1 Tax=Gaeumannomyces tritici (strain R3-111a-1) TaxID=644352 RepID=J3NSG5_GAET3|nr:hypothetical protein GGTG_04217 [Gaeumannomyces tritici R3-111a-1]EJT79128.1 hypothetical protein GGTG_04217 [Gaeumannomyces tritici R3-111a-1]